ncbi:Rieske 2Fe-2S domain-containing protein [Pedobacter sp. HMF7647]|uniref:Rieske 2Fe-2S domain-containing protein n=1 Tax=Hufsiella arboris TaxID=2695275 RepID=A0A7K1Y879_9SPHI|nr:Rieske (2Fe-2S) protein [Hufsiella arboris]MXV50630.1 Rieske 2Fe-2S domain-containing protein [Hufsiella arboris]
MKDVKIYGPDILQANDFVESLKAAGRHICVIKTDGQFYATQPKCPHAGARLSEGWCENKKLVCPYHRYQYDLETGRGAVGQGDYITIYPVEIKPDGVYVKLPEAFGFIKKLFKI